MNWEIFWLVVALVVAAAMTVITLPLGDPESSHREEDK
jgi:hypothetical protein